VTARIVVVEDDSSVAELVMLYLRNAEFIVVHARTAAEARLKFDEEKPALVILDLGLPGLDGFEVAQRLRAEHGAGLRIIALTAYASEDARTRARHAGCDAHLVKPLDPRFLESLLA